MTKALLAAFVLAGSVFFVGCAEEPPTVTGTSSRSPASTGNKGEASEPTTDRAPPSEAPGNATTTPATSTTATTTTTDKTVSPKDVDVKPIDPAKPAAPQLPAFACATESDSVTASYKIALLRAPDGEGLSYWTLQVQSGAQTRIDVLRNMVRSDEFAKNRAVLTDDQFVTSLYTGFLARQPDEDGKAFWVASLANGTSRTDVALGFVNSEEFADPASNKQASCYF